MNPHADSLVRRALASIRRTYADLDRISRAMVEVTPPATRR